MFNSQSKKIGFRLFSSNNEKSISEDQWVDLIRSGDSSAFELMFRSYYPRLCQFAYRSIRSTEAAEDLVQSVFLNIWKNRRDWNPRCKPCMYLYKATRNQVINYLKHKNVENLAEFVDVFSIQIEKRTPEDTFREKQCSEAIYKSVNRLPERCRLIFLMKKEDGLTYNEISEILGISVKTVETQMGRALRFLRENLTEYT